MDTFTHKSSLPPAVMDTLKPVIKELAKTDLLQKCLHGYTQNANQRLNCTIWKYCPKTKHHGVKSAETATAIAVSAFNDGASSFMAILRQMYNN